MQKGIRIHAIASSLIPVLFINRIFIEVNGRVVCEKRKVLYYFQFTVICRQCERNDNVVNDVIKRKALTKDYEEGLKAVFKINGS